MKVKIKRKKYILKPSFRGLLLMEKEFKNEVGEGSLNDMLIMIYCYLKAANRESFKLTFDEFIDCLEEDNKIFDVGKAMLDQERKSQELLEKK